MALLECPSCRRSNAEGSKFCANCGQELGRKCPHCSAPINATDRFCSACGGLVASPNGAGERTAERRLTAVLFCDLVGWTPLSEKLDPEDLRALLRTYHDASARAVGRYEGHVAKYLGDGIVAFFGYPKAHEDDSQRAVLAGLAILEAIKEIGPDLERRFGVEVKARVGIHAGLVVAGEIGSVERPVIDIVGETPNVAARLQEVAPPNSLVVSAGVRRATQEGFLFEALGSKQLKGISRPVEVFRVLGPAEPEERSRRIVGRRQELAELERLWHDAQKGNGRLALLHGEPGIGKSALVGQLLERAAREPGEVSIVLRCSPYHQHTPFHPVVEYLRGELKISRTDSQQTQLDQLIEFARERGFEPNEIVPILAPLLSIGTGERFPSPLLSPEGRRIRTVETILQMTLRRATRFAVILVMEDLHWADPSTTELFGRVLNLLPQSRMLALATYRSHYRPQFHRPPGSVEIGLDRIDPLAVSALAQDAAGGRELPFELLDYIGSKTDGVPLFVEELTKAIIESGAVELRGAAYELVKPLRDVAIPTTLQGSLVARLERATGRRDIARVAAVVGREFSVNVVAAVAKVDEDTADRELSTLVTADLVYPVDAFAGGRAYRFRHALIQDAAYDSLLRSVRQQYHKDIAQTLETQFMDTAEEQPEVVATHYSSAGAVEAALTWWSRAGQKALGRSANLEAIAHFSRGLELLETAADSPAKIQTELAMLAQRGTALIATRGFAAPEVGETFRRAETICELIGETPLLFPVIWGLWVYHLVRSDLEASCEYAEQMLRLAQIAGESGMFLEGHFTLGDSLFWLGELKESKAHLDQALALYDPELHRSHIPLYGQDPGVTTLCYSSYTYLSLGFPDQALAFADRAHEVAQQSRHPFSIGWALAFGGMIRNWRKEYEQGKAWAERCHAYCSEQGQAFWSSASLAQIGWATFHLGDREEGLTLLRDGLAGYELTGSIVVTPLWRAILCESLIEVDELDEAAAVADAGLATIAEHHEWVTQPFLVRLKGDIFAKRGQTEEAENAYQLSLEQAERQGSKLRALQAAMALVRLRGTEPQFDKLSNILASFTEGAETEDLKLAASLLGERAARNG